MRRYLALALACALAAVSVSALALGLGEIRLNSYLNQRLDAEIELVSAAADELESLQVSLAGHDAYARYGLDRSPILNTLQFRVVRRPNGTAYLKVTSTENIKEPFLTFLIEANWSRGRVLREYTVLLDPPTFAGREDAAREEAAAQAPAVTPERSPSVETRVEREPSLSRPEPLAEQPRVTEERTGDVISIPSLDTEVEETGRDDRIPTDRFAEAGEESTYGPIQRNENLWSIAMRVRPDESITINQMMIALYRANPEAFQGNINRLKAGYVLRIPAQSDIRAIGRREAFQEARRHNEEWQSARSGGVVERAPAVEESVAEEPAVEPELSLVAPEEDSLDLSSDIDAGGETGAQDAAGSQELDAPVEDDAAETDLGLETESPERLLEIEDESLQALQSQEDAATQATEEETLETPPQDLPAETGEDAAAAQPAEEPAAETAPVEDRRNVPPVVRQPEPNLLERVLATVLSPLGLGVAAALLVLLLAGFLVLRRRREANAAAASGWEDADSDDATIIVHDEDPTDAAESSDDGFASAFEHDFADEDTGTTRLEDDAAATQLLNESGKTQVVQPEPGLNDTMVGGQAVTLDENDPMSEADFHMAYGLYDQAAEVVEKAVARDPSRKDWIAKLAEIHFAGNNTQGFLDAARKLHALAGPGDSDWDNVAIMGRQIAPDEAMFAEGGSTGAVDLDFGSAAEEFDGAETVVGSPSPQETAPPSGDLDFDLPFDPETDSVSIEEPEAPGEAQAADNDGLDFDLDLGDVPADEPSEQESPETEESAASDDFNFDLGDLGDTDDGQSATDSSATGDGYTDDETQTEFDKALQELSAYVDTNLPEEDAGDAVGDDAQDGELNLDEFNFDQPDDGFGDDIAEGIGEDEDDIGEIGTKLDLARAYIDMGDPDGARGILDEVLADGDEDQQREARELLEQLS